MEFLKKYKQIIFYVLIGLYVLYNLGTYFLGKSNSDLEIIQGSVPEILSEEKTQIPENTDVQAAAEAAISESPSSHDGRINLNTADSALLQTVKGIGPVTAERIIEYRNSYGSFSCVEELTEVKGIGEKTLSKIKDFFFVE